MNKSVEIVTDRILTLMELGEIPWARPWRGDAHAPRNAVSNRSYSGINAFLLTMANYSNNRFVTFKQALELGGNVKKGQHGWPVIYVKQLSVEDKNTGELKEIPFCKHYTIFNVSQCENLPEKFNEPVQVADNPVIPTCAEVAQNMPNRPEIVHGFNQAAYCRGTDQVEMPSLDQFNSSEEYYDTVFHELAHATSHQSRIGRFQPGVMNKFGSKEYGKEELIAEITAAALCHEAQIFDKVERNTTAYLQGWIKKIREDKTSLISAARQAERAADYILNVESNG
jgi:antirestriction protein ArdC